MDFPKSVPSVGLVGGKFIDENPLLGTPGSLIPSEWGNAVTLELLNVISSAGLAPDEFDNTQLLAAIRNIIQGAKNGVLVDTGVAGAYAAANLWPLSALPATGYVQRVKIANANPGAATYAPDGLAAKPIYGLGLQPLQGGELPAGVAILVYLVQAGVNGGNGAWILIESLGGAMQVAPATQSRHAVQLGQVSGLISGVVGQGRNVRMSVTAAAALATLTADEITVETALGGLRYCLSSFSKTIDLTKTGVGGMDTGAAPVSGAVAVYAIYNPALALSSTNPALVAVNATSVRAPEVYGGANMPAGYTASALAGVYPTNASAQFPILFMEDRHVILIPSTVLTTSTVQGAFAPITMASVPLNAVAVDMYWQTQSAGTSSMDFAIAASSSGLGSFEQGNRLGVASLTVGAGAITQLVITPRTTYYKISSGSAFTCTIQNTGYRF